MAEKTESPAASPIERTTVVVTRLFNAPPEKVFDAWLDPKSIGKWLFATEHGQTVRVEIDARVGGTFIITERRDGQDIEHVGEYLELDRPRRLVFKFCVPKFFSESTTVAIDIEPQGAGSKLTLTHEGVFLDYRDRTQEGWTKILAGLDNTIASPA